MERETRPAISSGWLFLVVVSVVLGIPIMAMLLGGLLTVAFPPGHEDGVLLVAARAILALLILPLFVSPLLIVPVYLIARLATRNRSQSNPPSLSYTLAIGALFGVLVVGLIGGVNHGTLLAGFSIAPFGAFMGILFAAFVWLIGKYLANR